MEFIDIRAQYEQYQDEIDHAVHTVLRSGHFIMGDKVRELEQKLALRLAVPHVISCGNGTDALQLLYMAYEVGPGDAVFVPNLTFIATHEPACMLGAEVVFCDVDPDTYNLSPAALERQIVRVMQEGRLSPKCIVGVDFLGNPCDWDALTAIARKYGLLLFEDAAQGIGATYKGKPCGTFGDAAATSFFPTKPLGCYGDGGAVFVKDDYIAQKIRSLKVHGQGSSKYDNVRIGINSRLDELQAAILLVKLNHFDEELKRRNELAELYRERLGHRFIPQMIRPECSSAYAQFALLAADEQERDRVLQHMKNNAVPSLLYYPRAMHQLPVFAGTVQQDSEFLAALRYVRCHFCVPFSPFIKECDLERVLSVLDKMTQ